MNKSLQKGGENKDEKSMKIIYFILWHTLIYLQSHCAKRRHRFETPMKNVFSFFYRPSETCEIST